MKLFQKIKDRLRQNAVLEELLEEIKDLDEVLLEKRLEIFNEKVTPEFFKIGLTNWDGKYKWYSDFNEEGIKHVVEYNVFKYYGGSFTYGNCYFSVPTFSSKKLVNHRTDKSTMIHFYKRLSGWQKSMELNSRDNPDKISTINEKKFKTTLDDVLSRNISQIKNWFKEHSSLEQNIEGLVKVIENPPYEIGQRIISCEYILSFLFKQKGDLNSSEKWLNKHFDKNLKSAEEKILLMKKIKEENNAKMH